jgi:hypothetical protein
VFLGNAQIAPVPLITNFPHQRNDRVVDKIPGRYESGKAVQFPVDFTIIESLNRVMNGRQVRRCSMRSTVPGWRRQATQGNRTFVDLLEVFVAQPGKLADGMPSLDGLSQKDEAFNIRFIVDALSFIAAWLDGFVSPFPGPESVNADSRESGYSPYWICDFAHLPVPA